MQSRTLSRRAALALPLAATGCSLFDDWFGETKKPLEGKRLPVLTATRGLAVDNPSNRPVTLPPPAANAAWPQPGGTATHDMGHLAARDTLAEAWRVSIGTGGGYRDKITARPVVAGGRVFTMDSAAGISAFDLGTGARLWRFDAQPDSADSTNVGGGLAFDAGTLFASTGFAELLALDPVAGKPRWRTALPTPARSGPTVADGRVYVATLDDQITAHAVDGGARVWAYQGKAADTALLGLPAPAFADGLLVAGFGSGDLVCLRAGSGSVNWSDSLAAARGRTSLVDLSAIRGMPVIVQGRVYAVGLGGLCLSLDLRSGRRLWERDIASQETPWMAGDWMFVLTDSQALVALNRQDGAVAWITQLPRWENEERQQDPITWVGPALAGDRLIVAGSTRQALAVSPYSGKVLGTQSLSGAASLAPVIAGGAVFLVTDDGSLLALR